MGGWEGEEEEEEEKKEKNRLPVFDLVGSDGCFLAIREEIKMRY